jgi:hypothetical protein
MAPEQTSVWVQQMAQAPDWAAAEERNAGILTGVTDFGNRNPLEESLRKILKQAQDTQGNITANLK